MNKFRLLCLAVFVGGVFVGTAIYNKIWGKDETDFKVMADQLDEFMNGVHEDLRQEAESRFSEVIKEES